MTRAPAQIWPLAALALALSVATCRDALGPRGTGAGQGRVVFAPILPSEAALASFGLAIDQVRIIVVRPAADTLADTTVALPPDSAGLDLNLNVALLSSPETLSVSVIALSGVIPLFQGTSDVEVTTGSGTPTPSVIPIDTYVGPGAGVDSIAITPRSPFIYLNDSLRFQVEAFQAGAPVTQFYIAWSTSDSTIATVNAFGVLRAPATRTSVRVVARTPGGSAADSTTATFVSVPTQLVIIAGGGQTGPAGQPLATQLEVEVRAADNLPVPGVDVRFRSLSGGTPDTVVTSDAQGRAQVTGVLGATPGPQQFQASLPAFPGVAVASFNVTATGVVISPATSLVTVASGSVVSGDTVTLRLQGKDASGADITTGGATVVFNRSGGSSTGSIGATADSGNGVYTAVFTGALAGTATTIGATINGAPVTSTLPTIAVSPGAITHTTSVVTVSNDTVASGDSVTLRLQGRDAAGNNVAAGGATVTFGLIGGSGNGTIGTTADSGNGIYTTTFTGVAAGSGGLVGAVIDGNPLPFGGLPSLTIIPGAPARVAFLSPIAGVQPGFPIAPAIEVYVRDVAGNVTPSFTGNVTMTIGDNPSGGTLSGTLTQPANAGVATFADLSIDMPGNPYTLVAAASGLASDTTLSFSVLPPAGTVSWVNTAGGNWSNPANWAGGVVPGTAEIAAITIPGTYTVTLDVNDTIAGLQLGGSSGTQTLAAASRLLHVSGAAQVNANGVLDWRASTLAGGPLINAGTVLSTGSVTISTGVSTSGTSLIRAQGNNVYGAANLTFSNGFTNNGTIVLTDTVSSYGATLSMVAGLTLVNGPGGTIDAAVGSAGPRTLALALDNQGTVTVNRGLALNRASVAHTNSGTINVSGGDLTVTQSGTSPSFATSGAITIGAGHVVQVSGGTFNYTGGTITGPGTLAFTNLTAGITPNLSTGAVPLSFTSTTIGGAGTLTVAPSTALELRASTINTAFDNQGFVTATGSTVINGPVTNAGGATLRAQGNNVYGAANLTVATGFTNNGTIVLTDTVSSYGATLTMPAGATLTNAAGGAIDAAAGFAGARTLALALDNQGTVALNRALTINRAGAAHTNSGTIDVSGGDLTLTQSGGGASFTMAGAGSVTVGPARTFAVSGGALNYTSGTISGGTLSVTSTAVTSTQPFNTATAALIVVSSTWGGSGTITVGGATALDVRASTISAPLVNQTSTQVTGSSAFTGGFSNPSGATLTVLGNNVYGAANLTVGSSFTNGGTIVLSDTVSSYGATITMPGGATLTNAPGATIDAAVGFAGARTLTVELDNQGTVTLNRPLTLSRASATHLNSGTIDVNGGDFTVSQTGTSPSFTTSGTIAIGGGRTFAISGGAFNYNAGSISGGTLSVTSTNVTATQNFNTATASLSIASSTWGGTGTLTVSSGTAVLLRASTINAALVNQGLLVETGSSAINGALTNESVATLRVRGDGTYGAALLTVANGFTNDGSIELSDTTSSYGATLTVTSGTLLNASSGTIAALTGFSGGRALNAQLDNRGAIDVLTAGNQGLTIGRASSQHQNRGTITISGGDLTVNLTGTGPSFRNTGTIAVAAGDTLHVNGGSFVHDSGTIGGAGALTLAGLTGTAAFNIAHSIASLAVTSSTASFATAQSTGSTGFFFSSAVINGPGLLTNATGQFLNVRSSTINADLVNSGTLLVNGGSTFTGVLTTNTSSLIRVQGNGVVGHSTMTVSNAFTNNGTIELTDTTSTYGATLNAAGGTLTNSPTGTIAAVLGAGGSRTLSAQLDNQGAVAVAMGPNGLFTFGRSGAVHQNSGVIDVSSGDVTLTQTVGGSLTNTGSVTVAAGDTLTINNGSVTHDAGTFGGAGMLVLSGVSPATFNVPHTFAAMNVSSSTVAFATPQSTGATGFAFIGSVINGPGSLTNDLSRTLTLRSTVVNAALSNLGTLVASGATTFNDTLTTGTSSLLRVKGDGTSGSSNLTVTRGFENAGTVELTDTVSSYGATLTVPNGKLVNLTGAFLNAATGANGARTLTATLDNQGAVAVTLAPTRDLAINKSAAAHVNSGTIDIVGGGIAINAGASFQNIGAINLGAGDTLSITNGAFSYDAGTLGAGTLILTSVNPANFNKAHTLGAIVLNGTTANFAPAQTTASTDFTLTNSVFGGTGTLTNAGGKTIRMRSSGISAPFVNQGTVIATGASSLDALTTVAGSIVRVEGDGTSGLGTLTVNGGMVNNGGIELTDIVSSYGATLVVKTLPLVNLGTIDILPGANGGRTIDATIDNQGTFTANQGVTISPPAGVAHSNRGTYKVKAGAITFSQPGGNPSFTNQAGGIIDIDAGTDFRVTNGPVTNALGGKIVGFGTLDVRPLATFTNDGELFPGSSPGVLTINAGTGTIPFGSTSILNVEIAGPTPGTQHDQLLVTGSAVWAGTLNVSLLSFTPTSGQQFVLARCSVSCTNRFGTENLPPALVGANIAYVGNQIVLTAP